MQFNASRKNNDVSVIERRCNIIKIFIYMNVINFLKKILKKIHSCLKKFNCDKCNIKFTTKIYYLYFILIARKHFFIYPDKKIHSSLKKLKYDECKKRFITPNLICNLINKFMKIKSLVFV